MWVWLRRCFMTFHGRSEEATLLSSWIWLRLMTGLNCHTEILIFFWMWMDFLHSEYVYKLLVLCHVEWSRRKRRLLPIFPGSQARGSTGAFSLYSCRRSTQQRLVLSYLCSKRLSSLFTLLEAALSSRFICWWYNHLYQWQCSVA